MVLTRIPVRFLLDVQDPGVSNDGQANVGDQTGHGAASVIIRGDCLCFAIIISRIDTPTVGISIGERLVSTVL